MGFGFRAEGLKIYLKIYLCLRKVQEEFCALGIVVDMAWPLIGSTRKASLTAYKIEWDNW